MPRAHNKLGTMWGSIVDSKWRWAVMCVVESAERILMIFSHVTPSSGIRPEDFASLIALDSSSLINNPCREFLVMQREAAAKGLSRSDMPLRYDIRGLAGNKSWHREEAAWEPRDSGHGISLNDNPSSFVHCIMKMERKDRGHRTRTNPPFLFLCICFSVLHYRQFDLTGAWVAEERMVLRPWNLVIHIHREMCDRKDSHWSLSRWFDVEIISSSK